MNKLKKHGIYYDSRIKLLLILLTSALAFALGGGLTGLLLIIKHTITNLFFIFKA